MQLKKLTLTLLAGLTLGLASFNLQAAEKPTIAAKEELISYINSFNSFTANFKQTAKTPQGKVVASSSGVLQALKPHYLFIHTKKNRENFLWVQGKEVTSYDSFVEQVTKMKVRPDETLPFQHLLNGNPADWQNIEVTKTKSGTNSCYALKEANNKYYSSLSICLTPNQELASVTIRQKNNNTNTYNFSNFSKAPLSVANFTPKYPEGTPVEVKE